MTSWEKRLKLALFTGTLLLATNAWLVMSGQLPAGDRQVRTQEQVAVESPTVDTLQLGQRDDRLG